MPLVTPSRAVMGTVTGRTNGRADESKRRWPMRNAANCAAWALGERLLVIGVVAVAMAVTVEVVVGGRSDEVSKSRRSERSRGKSYLSAVLMVVAPRFRRRPTMSVAMTTTIVHETTLRSMDDNDDNDEPDDTALTLCCNWSVARNP